LAKKRNTNNQGNYYGGKLYVFRHGEKTDQEKYSITGVERVKTMKKKKMWESV